jgi:hypothetical protein
MNEWRTMLIGFSLIFLGILAIIKSNKWVMLLVDSWFLREFTKLEINLMRIGWKIMAIFFIAVGVLILINLWL